jgi:hypothetical protein
MKGTALREERFVDVGKLFHEVVDDVPELAKGIGGIQQPHIMMPSLEGCNTGANCDSGASFDVGELSPEDRMAIPLATAKPFLSRPLFLNSQLHRDSLHLTDALRNRLRSESYASVSGEGALKAIYVDEDDFAGAIGPTGDYNVEGSHVKITLVLAKDGHEVSHYTIQGTTDDLDTLCSRIVAQIEQALPK